MAARSLSKRLARVRALFTRAPDATVISFSGGMGAQIISAAIYYMLRERGERVFADMRYFEQEARVAVTGNAGEVSLWPWQLDCFGIQPSAFHTSENSQVTSFAERIDDGARKLELGIEALRLPQVQARFPVPPGIEDVLGSNCNAPYLCIHIRRGDYVNVASHLVGDAQFIAMARNYAALVQNAVVVSDSPIAPEIRQTLSALFARTEFKDDISAFDTHRLMRKAHVLVGSNSQFSLIAALLNTEGMIALPRKWFSDDGLAELENAVRDVCDFQILNRINEKVQGQSSLPGEG